MNTIQHYWIYRYCKLNTVLYGFVGAVFRQSYYLPVIAIGMLAILLPTNTYATTTNSGNRWALVIGNKDYADAPLDNPINDATDMKTALEQVGFRVIYRENADLPTMDAAVHEFINSLNKDSVGVFYYSGHGAQTDGGNYLIPIGADINTKSELKSRAYDAEIVLGEMQEVGNPVNILILDACRSNPFKGFRGGSRGLATMSGPKGSLIAYATAPGSTADDNSSERNGAYTKFLKHYLVQPGLKIEEMFKKIRESVVQNDPDQVPWENSSIMGDFCFAGCETGNANMTTPINTPITTPTPAPIPPVSEQSLPEQSEEETPVYVGKLVERYPMETENPSHKYQNETEPVLHKYQRNLAADIKQEVEPADAVAQYNLGTKYDKGDGVVQDHAKAFYWFQKAANQGDADAQYNLGTMYETGQGIEQDDAKAIFWYKKAAKQGDADAKAALTEINQ